MKLDVHYSHRDPTVFDLCKENRVAVTFATAGCTDIRQEMDTAINFPFKMGAKDSFSAEMHRDFLTFTGDAHDWEPN